MKEVICTCCPQGCHLLVDEANVLCTPIKISVEMRYILHLGAQRFLDA